MADTTSEHISSVYGLSMLTLEIVPRDIPADEVRDAEEDDLVVSNRKVAEIFNPVIEKILHLIEDQIRHLQGSNSDCQIAGILLVGGFGSNEYLRQRVKHHFNNQYEVTRPINALVLLLPMAACRLIEFRWTSVVRGAIMWGTENNTVTGRKARYSYGIELDLPWDPKWPRSERCLSNPSPHIIACAALKAFLNRKKTIRGDFISKVMRWHIKAVSVPQSPGM